MVLLSEEYLWKRVNSLKPLDARMYLKILAEYYNSDFACNVLGLIYNRTGDIKKALNYFERAANIQPNSINYYNLGIYCMNIGEQEKGVSYLEKANKIEPDNPEILTTLGGALFSVKSFKKAEYVLKKALEIDPKNDFALVTLINLLLYQERFDDAQDITRRYRGNAPGGI